MKEKIDWYQEVLDLEPGSKVFFPLAKLLAQNNEILRAIDTLQHGLDRHPEYIEARLYLAELLHQNSEIEANNDKLEEQLKLLTPLLARYAGFWQAWSSSAQAQKGDTGLAIAFLAAVFKDNSLSLSEIFTKGLQASLGDEKIGNLGDSGGGSQAGSGTDGEQDIIAEASLAAVAAEIESIEDAEELNQIQEPTHEHTQEPTKDLGMDEDGEYYDEDEEEEGEERFSLRTRSMAEVLAEQGDYAGALEIYRELENSSESAQEKEDLQSRISTLSALLGNLQEQAEVVEEVEESSPGKERILSALETLAVRLENRAHS